MKRLLLVSLLVILTACQAGSGTPIEVPSQDEPAFIPESEVIPEITVTEEANPQSGQLQAAEGYLRILELVVRDLALRLNADLNTIKVSSVESVEWPTSGLGCENPDIAYTQVSTLGYQIDLEYQGSTYSYHTDQEQAFWLCQDGLPQLPRIPVDPDEIQDGIPWMPVDPVPTVAPGDVITDPDPVK